MTAHADLAEVRAALALVAQATPGPWRTFGRWPHLAVVSGSDRPRIVASLASASDDVDDTPKDAAAIVALRNAAPAIAAAVEELERLRADNKAFAREREIAMKLGGKINALRELADEAIGTASEAPDGGDQVADYRERLAVLNRQVCRLVSGQEIEGDLLCQHHGADVAALALLADERAAHAETSRDLDALLTALGAQVTPGGQTLAAGEERRVADGMRLARELVAAREVPADVEAAIASLVAAARDATNYEPDRTTVAKHLTAERLVKEAIADIRAAIAAEIERARVSAREEFDNARRVFFEDMLRRRDITSPCQECEGYGVRAYPSTATWHRGAGGQMVTSDVCDRCWGSGDAVKRGVDLRKMASAASALPPIDDDAQELIDGLVAANRPAAGKRTAIAKAAPDVYLAPWEAEDLLKRIGNTYDLETTAGRNRADAAMRRALDLLGVSAPSAPAPVARPISEWHEDRGSALWWRFPVEEPPYSGSPLDSDWPGYHTHWTPIVCPDEPHDQADADPASRGPIGGGS